MDITNQTNNNSPPILFELDSKKSLSTGEGDQQLSNEILVIGAWLIQLARYSSLDKINLLLAPDSQRENSQSDRKLTVEIAGSSSVKQWLFQLQIDLGKPLCSSDNLPQNNADLHAVLSRGDPPPTTQKAKFSWFCSITDRQLTVYDHDNQFPNLEPIRFNQHFSEILSQFEIHLNDPISSVECMPERERHKVVTTWNQTDRDYPLDICVHQLFTRQAESTPSQTALRFKGESFSYKQVDEISNQFAGYILENGIQAGDVVGLCLSRSTLWPIGMLAIWKIGAIFLPLEAELPDQRLEFIIEDSRCKLVVTEDALAHRFDTISCSVVSLQPSYLKKFSDRLQAAETSTDTLAYIMYTSGTTGLPKGVQINHRGLTNLPYCQYERMNFAPNQRVLQAVSFNFDASLHDVTFALLSGGTLCIADKNERLPGPAMVKFLINEKINFLTLPPSALETLPLEDLPDLHTLLAVGEVCSASLVNRWVGKKHFYNGYGPTETTVGALIGECFTNEEKPTIGKALANTKTYILDHRMKPVPIGVVGEIYVGGVGVARGYLNQPERTKQSFVSNPFSSDTQSLLYKTGDNARFLEDGRVDFIGRVDTQVKIAGRRIEVEEIEARCKTFESVENAAIVVHKEADNNKLIRAFILLKKSIEGNHYVTEINRLRIELAKYLPSYMLPNQFYLIKAFPTTINGKLDSNALLNIESKYPESSQIAKEQLSINQIFTSFLPIGDNVYVPITYYAKGEVEIEQQEIVKTLESILTPCAHSMSYFSLGSIPEIKTKKDRLQLPIPSQFQTKWQQKKSLAATPIEKQLAKVWKQQLGIDELYLQDSFIDIGGDSIRAVKIILEIKKAFKVELTGADIFGSSFEYCAARLESLVTGEPMNFVPTITVDEPEPVEAFFFPSQNNSLYAVFHPANKNENVKQAVLICPPITNDYQRSRPMLQQMACKLAALGYNVMRFDYFGCGDSQGDSESMTLEILQENINSAISVLVWKSGIRTISLFGTRFGANLLHTFKLPESVNQVILFDPFDSGQHFIDKQRGIHKSMLKDPQYFQWRRKPNYFDQFEEILGQSLSKSFIQQIESIESNDCSRLRSTTADSLKKDATIIRSNSNDLAYNSIADSDPESNVNVITIEDDCGWSDSDKIDTTIITRSLIPAVIATLRRNTI